jgi:hypothetical protein
MSAEAESNRRANQMARKILAAFPDPQDYRRFVRRVWKHPIGQEDMIERIERQARRRRGR